MDALGVDVPPDLPSVAPPVVYLPVVLDPAGEVADVKMMRLDDGRVALLGYSALDRFQRCWGEAHPWVLFDARHLDDLRAAKPFDLRVLDVVVPEHLRGDAVRP
ncbi:hypothetical protein QE364_000238 [Nocardioides zeae]|uniref:Uncharacterized protein n=2 Tax=Nocardioides zeae TaxID=1457234 RepID=A0ACC6ICT5_9ACTN|nr:SAV_915 family protein [Nocardioides zeae]MDQ1104688.1 hypothetical protein [Nocardioides zeae]MDR6175621.1 hypothetical protein [Nocardioides zeae]MDR6208550.1 hypothetical protein [Nocardioides zeae]